MGKYWGDTSVTYGDAARFYDDAPADFDADRLEHRFEVAWRGKTDYFAEDDGRVENIRAVGCYWRRGRNRFVNQDGRGLSRYEPGRLVITLANDDLRYDPYYTSSPLYGYIAPDATSFKCVRYGVRKADSEDLQYNNVYNWRFAGVLLDVRCYENSKGERFAELTVACGWQWLQDRAAYLPAVAAESVTTFFQRLLDDLQWPWDTDFGTAETLPYGWSGGDDARTVIHQAAEAFGGHAYINGLGELCYRQRTFVPTVVQAFEQSDLLRVVPVNNPWEYQFNAVDLIYDTPYSNSGALSLWGDPIAADVTYAIFEWGTSSQGEVSIAAGATIELSGRLDLDRASFSGLNYRLLFIQTVSFVTEFLGQFRTATGGGGSDISGFIDVSLRSGGTGFVVVLTNRYSATAYSNKQAAISPAVLSRTVNSGSILDDRSSGKVRKLFSVKSPYLLLNATLPQASLALITAYYADLVATSLVLPTLPLEARPDIQFRDIQDWVAASLPKLGLANDFYVGHIDEKWLTPNGQAMATTLKTEPEILAASGFRLLEDLAYRLLEDGSKRLLG